MTEEQDESGPAGFEVTRFIPVPTTVSPEAQAFLAMSDLFGEAGDGYPDPTDIEAWRAMITTANEMMIAVLGAQPPVPSSTVEETVVGDVPVVVLTPDGLPGAVDPAVYLDIHGGGLIMGGGEACRVMARKTAAMVRMTTWSPTA